MIDTTYIPEEWEVLEISDIVEEAVNGGTPKRSNDEYWEGSIDWLSSGEIIGKEVNSATESITQKGLNESSAKVFPKNSVLVAMYGATRGQSTILRKEMSGNQAICCLKLNSDYVIPEYVLYYIKNIKQNLVSEGRGGGQKNINQSIILEQNIPVPPINQQERLVNKIEELVTQIETGSSELDEVNDKLSRYKTSVMKAAVEGRLTTNWRKETQQEVLNVDSYTEPDSPPTSLIKIPQNWTWGTVGDVSTSLRNGIYKSKEHYSDDGIACLRMYNIEGGKIVWKDIKRIDLTDDEIEKYKLKPGDFLVNRVNSRKLVGKAAPIPSGLETCVYESKNIRIRLEDTIEPEYLRYWFYIYRRRYFTNILQQTVGQASITQKQLRNMPLPIPPVEEQSEIVNRAESRLSVINEIDKRILNEAKRSENLKQSVLREAFKRNLLTQPKKDDSSGTKSDVSETRETLVQKKLHELGDKIDE